MLYPEFLFIAGFWFPLSPSPQCFLQNLVVSHFTPSDNSFRITLPNREGEGYHVLPLRQIAHVTPGQARRDTLRRQRFPCRPILLPRAPGHHRDSNLQSHGTRAIAFPFCHSSSFLLYKGKQGGYMFISGMWWFFVMHCTIYYLSAVLRRSVQLIYGPTGEHQTGRRNCYFNSALNPTTNWYVHPQDGTTSSVGCCDVSYSRLLTHEKFEAKNERRGLKAEIASWSGLTHERWCVLVCVCACPLADSCFESTDCVILVILTHSHQLVQSVVWQ